MITKREFEGAFCNRCGTQKCMGVDSEDALGCPDFRHEVLGQASELSPDERALELLIQAERETEKPNPSTSGSCLPETSGHRLEIGDKVKMNIKVIGEGDLDGVEFTNTGKNYWRYMNQHPEEVYTVVDFDFSNDEEVSYVLSGYMSDNNWYSSELILVAEPKTNFEALKNMTKQEMAELLGQAMKVPAKLMLSWLDGKYIRR